MEPLLDSLLDLFIYSYTGSVILLTYLLLKLKSTTDKQKLIVTLLVGLLLGILWVALDLIQYGENLKPEYDKLIYSFLFANVFYKYVISSILNKFNISYTYKNNNDDDTK